MDSISPTTLDSSLNDPHNLGETCRQTIDFALEVTRAKCATIVVLNPIDGSIVRVYSRSRHANAFVYPDKDPFVVLDNDRRRLFESGSLLISVTQKTLKRYRHLFPELDHVESIIALNLIAPRSTDQKELGVLYLSYEKKPRDLAFEQGIAGRVAEAASSALQHTWSIRRYKNVAEIGQEINKDLTGSEIIFRLLTKGLPKILDASYYFMMGVYNQDANRMDYYVYEKNEVHSPNVNQPLKRKGGCRYVISKNESLNIHAYSKEWRELDRRSIKIIHQDKTEDLIPESMIFLPLSTRGAILGVLSLQHPQENAFDNEDYQILELLSHYVALALSNLRWKNGLEKLMATGQNLTQKLDAASAMQEVVDLLRKETHADIVSLHPYDHRLGRFIFPVIYTGKFQDPDFPKPERALSDDSASLALLNGRSIFCDSRNFYQEIGGKVQDRKGGFEKREKIKSVAILPMQIGNKPVGVLFLNFRKKQLFLGSQRSYLEGLATFVGIALVNSDELQEVNRRYIAQLEALRVIDHKIIETNDRKDIFDTILLTTARSLQNAKTGIAQGTILLHDSSNNTLVVKSHPGDNERIRLKRNIKLGDKKGFTYQAFTGGVSVRVGNVNDQRYKSQYLMIDQTTRSELDTPIKDGDKVIGVIGFESNRLDYFTENDEKFLNAVANQVVVAIKKTDAFRNEIKAKENELAIASVAKKIIEDHLDFEGVIELVMNKALELTNSKAGAILLYDVQDKNFKIASGRNILPEKHSERLSEVLSLVGASVWRKESIIADVRVSPWKEIHQPWIAGSDWALVTPMLKGGKKKIPLGAIAVEGKREFTEQDQRLLDELSDLAVIAFENAQQHADAIKTLETLNETSRALGIIADPASIDRAYELVGQKLHAEEPDIQVVIRRYKIETQSLDVAWKAKPIPPKFESLSIANDPTIEEAFEEKKTLLISDTENPPDGMKLNLSDPKMKSLVIAWLAFGERKFGSVGLSHPKRKFFQPMHLKLIEGMAQLLGVTIQRLEAAEEGRTKEVYSALGMIAGPFMHDMVSELSAIRHDYDLRFSDGGKQTKEEFKTFLKGVVEDTGEVAEKGAGILQIYRGFSVKERELIGATALLNSIKDVIIQNRRFKKKDIKIIWKIPANLPAVNVVQVHILDVVQNLINNALDAIKHKHGEIEILASQKNSTIKIQVADNGEGFPPGDKERIFELGHTTKGSSGFGLYYSRSASRFNGGELSADNRKDCGAVFTLTLPTAGT